MLMLSKSPLTLILEDAYAEACASNPGIDLPFGRFAARILTTVNKHLPSRSSSDAASEFVRHLSTTDLYLTTACADGAGPAWALFNQVYAMSINALAANFTDSLARAQDLADLVRVSLFLPFGSAPSRIATYDGRSRLSTWLRSVTFNTAAHQHGLKDNSLVPLDPNLDLPGRDGARQIEAAYRANKYEPIIADTIRLAAERLTEPDRVLLLLHYEQQINMRDIAAMNRVNVSTISRRMKRIHAELGNAIISTLASRYLLPQPAIDECIQVMFDSLNHSILKSIRLSKAARE